MSQVVIGDILPYTQATATGGQTVFGTNWTANVASDVVVYQTPSGSAPNDATQILSYPSQFSVAFIGALQQVQVTLVSGANAGDIVTVTRMTPADRENLYTNTNFTPSMLNNDFGILTLVDQQAQLVNQLIGPRYNYSAVIAPNLSFPNANIILPILGANQVWLMNPTATEIIASTIGGGIPPGSGGVNPGLQNQIAYYATNGNVVSGSSISIVGDYLESPLGFKDSSGNILFGTTYIPSAVNYLNFTNNITGNAPSISALGADTNINLQLISKGTGAINLVGAGAIIAQFNPVTSAVNYAILSNNITGFSPVIISTGSDSTVGFSIATKSSYLAIFDALSTVSGKVRLYNAAGTHYTGLTVATAQSTSIDFSLPAVDGTALAPLVTNASGVLSFLPGAYIDYSGTIVYTGFSGTPTTNIAKWKQIGKTVFVVIDMTGTSNATGFTFTLPIAAGTTGTTIAIARAVDNGTYSSAVYGTIGNGGTTVGLVISDNGAGWTNSGTKSVRCSFFYETA